MDYYFLIVVGGALVFYNDTWRVCVIQNLRACVRGNTDAIFGS